MTIPFERTMLFLTYIKGPNVTNWVNNQVRKIGGHLNREGSKNDEYIWATMINDFANAFQDIMSKERADQELTQLKMERGEIDQYTARFEQLARLAKYDLRDKLLWKQYFRGLPTGLQQAIVDKENVDFLTTFEDWKDAAIRHQRKFLQFKAYFGAPPKNNRFDRPKPTQQQWQRAFAKDPNAMDLSPGRTRARAALTDDEMAQLRKEGKCFRCKRQGHIGRFCPDKQNAQIRATQTTPDATNTSTASSGTTVSAPVAPEPEIKKITAQRLVELVRDLEDDDKDYVIQEAFMKGDFA
jgi:hypothetical protein